MVSVFNINQPSLPTPFYSVLVSISLFMALSTVFYSIYSPDYSPISHSVLQVLILPYWSFQLYVALLKSSSALIQSIAVNWAQNTSQQTNKNSTHVHHFVQNILTLHTQSTKPKPHTHKPNENVKTVSVQLR